MTAAEQHPQRCETCNIKKCPACASDGDKPHRLNQVKWIIDMVGCASHSSATLELNKMLLRPCFGDFGDCPCDDECVVSEYCAKYHEDHEKNSCGMTESQCGEVHDYVKAEAAKQERERVLDELIDELPNVERSFGGEQIDTYIETHELKELVQSLRQQEAQR
jgi:hypothetical protein